MLLMRTNFAPLKSLLFTVLLFSLSLPLCAQAPLDDSRVMLQGFYWESHRFGHPDRFPQMGTKHWYEIVRADADAMHQGRFDLVWLPPPCYAGTISAGYNPKQYFNLNNSYGTFAQQRALLTTLSQDGVEPVADIVINHRDGSSGWTDFQNPDWGLWSICADDEAFSNPASPAYSTPLALRGAPEEKPTPYGADATTYAYPDFRDIDHTNRTVRRDILRYLLELKSAGYRGWRYDMVQGYHARWVALYNKRTQPTFSVGEYQWDREGEQRGWSWWTATTPGDLSTSSDVFDFSTLFTLKDNKGKYTAWYGSGNGLGLTGDTTDGVPWKQRSVTFLENHDTGYRTNEDGMPQPGHQFDSFANDWEVEQGYAYILTHPGVPCVYWKHYFDWGTDLQDKIRALINARKVAGVHSGSALHTQENARLKGVYAAMVDGKKGPLYVRIGGSDTDWQPLDSGYNGYRLYAHGNGWSVWVGLPGNPLIEQAPLARALPLPPAYQSGSQINIPDSWLE
jgi:alpha-amylase